MHNQQLSTPMRTMAVFTFILSTIVAANAAGQHARDARIEPASRERWAVLVGVDSYKYVTPNLNYCGADVQALGDRLVQAGFNRDCVVVLSDKAADSDYHPTKANIEKQLRLTLESVGPSDFVFLGFSGHGVRLDGKSYLCPRDAKMDAADLLVVDDIYKRLGNCRAKFKLFLVDACQNDKSMPKELFATRAVDEVKSFDMGIADKLPAGILLMTSCSPTQKSIEEPKFGHGVFTYFLLEGLTGRADADQNGEVSLLEWSSYAASRTRAYVRSLDRAQSPAMRGDFPDFDFAKVARIERIQPEVARPEPTRGKPTIYTTWPFDEREAKRRQEETAKALGQPVQIANSIGAKFNIIPAGEFIMGSPDGEKGRDSDEGPQHRVRITKPFYMGICEVTVGQFRQFVGDSGYQTDAERNGKGGKGYQDGVLRQKPEYTWRNPGFPQSNECPVVLVSWNDALAYCKWLSDKEGKSYRLPTEAEWEYACRAGTSTQFYWGSSDVESGMAKYCRYDSRSTDAVVQKQPNAWFLYDMSGNVWEWCGDGYGEKYDNTRSLIDDPVGPPAGLQVFRGGSWGNVAWHCRSASLCSRSVRARRGALGFRVVQRPVKWH